MGQIRTKMVAPNLIVSKTGLFLRAKLKGQSKKCIVLTNEVVEPMGMAEIVFVI